MGLETVIYLTNIIICAIIAVLMTEAWRTSQQRRSVFYWMVAAWVMLVADILFAARPVLPEWMDRIVPTALVTVGQSLLLAGSALIANRPLPRRMITAAVVTHVVLLTLFFLFDPHSLLRRLSNGLIWASLAFACFVCLRQSPAVFWKPLTAPAKVFFLHGSFHLLRLASAVVFEHTDSATVATVIEIMGDLEVSFFMVALFVGLLIAHVQQRNLELSSALAEVKTLSGLLPICAWCKKIRDDDGYWQQIDDYLGSHSKIRFTHGVCTDCAEGFRDELTKV